MTQLLAQAHLVTPEVVVLLWNRHMNAAHNLALAHAAVWAMQKVFKAQMPAERHRQVLNIEKGSSPVPLQLLWSSTAKKGEALQCLLPWRRLDIGIWSRWMPP